MSAKITFLKYYDKKFLEVLRGIISVLLHNGNNYISCHPTKIFKKYYTATDSWALRNKFANTP